MNGMMPMLCQKSYASSAFEWKSFRASILPWHEADEASNASKKQCFEFEISDTYQWQDMFFVCVISVLKKDANLWNLPEAAENP